MHMIAKSLALLLLGVSSGEISAWEFDPDQLPKLPPYCRYTQIYRDAVPGKVHRAEVERWAAILGGEENFQHLHHYCWGLEHTDRALYQVEAKGRVGRFEAANADFGYVIRNVRQDFILLPEIHFKRGQNLVRMGRGPEGVADFVRAISLKPDYWPPYAELSDFYKSLGDRTAARKWLEQGLSAAPNAKPLERRLADLTNDRSATKPTP